MAGSVKCGLLSGGSLPYHGTQAVRIGSWRVLFHLDAGALDHLDGATAPDGRMWSYRDLAGCLRGLDAGERRAVGAWLDSVEPWSR